MTVNLTLDTTSIAVASTIAEPVSGTDASSYRVQDGLMSLRVGSAVDASSDDVPVEELLGAFLDDLADELVPDDETASVLRDAWRRAQVRVVAGGNAPAGSDAPVDITDVHQALRTRPAGPSRAPGLVVGTGPGTVTFLPLTMQPTPRLSWALRLAANEARRTGADTLGIAHLVRGLLAEALPSALAPPIR